MVTISEEMRELRIERLKRQVDAGNYRVPAAEVAAAVLRFFARELPEPDPGLSPRTPR